MEFLRLLRGESDRDTISLLMVAVFSGIVSTLLVVLIIGSARQVSPGHLDLLNFTAFLFCLASYVFARRYSLLGTNALAERIVMKMRLRILDKIRHSNLLRYERVGRAEVYSALNDSAVTLSTSASYISTGFASAVMLASAMFYVAYLSTAAFVLILIAVGAGCILYANTRKALREQLQKSAREEVEFFGLVQHLLDGFKEVKIHRQRSDVLYGQYITTTAEQARDLKLETERYFAWMSVIGQNFLYVLLAVLIFVLPAVSNSDSKSVMQVATAIIFVMGPLGEVVGAIPLLMRSTTAIRNIRNLEATLDATPGEVAEGTATGEGAFSSFRQISLCGVSFAYEKGLSGIAFSLGPLDLTIRSNELLFIVGGNGSGKSTMLKLLTGLYESEGGSILVDSVQLGGKDLPAYRSLFSIIFTDFHLFDRLYGLGNVDQRLVSDWLRDVKLQNVTGITDGKFTRLDLSTGQRKRLALVVACLEERPIMIFDEVAADQDPAFRKYFYEVLLRRLQNDGKTIVAVTHDDHYFHVADRVLKMEDGKFVDHSL
jgi:putative pyoverdin transport system ATP-binding/permease protein